MGRVFHVEHCWRVKMLAVPLGRSLRRFPAPPYALILIRRASPYQKWRLGNAKEGGPHKEDCIPCRLCST